MDDELNPYESPRAELAGSEQTYFREVPRVPLPVWAILLTGMALPGLPSLLMRGPWVGGVRFAVLVAVVPVAFVVFGPVWGEVLFAHADHQTQEFGLWPFLGCCLLVPVVSTVLGFRDRWGLLRQCRACESASSRYGDSR